MNEQLQNALVSILGKAIDGIDASVAFMQAELPDVISQLLIWYGVKSAIYTLLAIAIIVIWFMAERAINSYLRGDDGEIKGIDFYITIYILMGSVLRAVFLAAIIVLSNLEWLQIWIAPKIWLIEYASNLTK